MTRMISKSSSSHPPMVKVSFIFPFKFCFPALYSCTCTSSNAILWKFLQESAYAHNTSSWYVHVMFRFAQFYILFSIHELLMVTFSCLQFSVHELLMVTLFLCIVLNIWAPDGHILFCYIMASCCTKNRISSSAFVSAQILIVWSSVKSNIDCTKGASVYRLTDTMWMTFSQQVWITHQRERKREVLWVGLWQSRRCPLTLFWNLFGSSASQYVPLKSLGTTNFPKSLFPSLSLPFSTMVAFVSLEIVWLYERVFCF